MALHFRLADEVYKALPKTADRKQRRHSVAATDGFVVVNLDEQNIGSFKNLYIDQALSKEEILMRYRVRNGAVKFATNAFFFQEGRNDKLTVRADLPEDRPIRLHPALTVCCWNRHF